jgi:hypothetical protein
MSQIFGAVRKSSFRGLVLQKIRWFLFGAVIEVEGIDIIMVQS